MAKKREPERETERETLRICCFGDSLTAGYSSNGGVSYYTYSVALTRRLSEVLSNTQVVAVDNGMPGDVVSQAAFAQRFETEMSGQSYDWVIVLGGTNDLKLDVPPEKVFESLKRVYDSALSKGSRVLALTIPICSLGDERLEELRRQLNTAILKHRAPNYYTFDAGGKIPYHALTDNQRRRYWAAGPNLGRMGQDWLGTITAEALGDLVELVRNPDSRRSKRTRRYIEEEDARFDEETGDPRELSEGYVVVRLRDLD